jgi:DNA transformation protein
MKRLNVSDGFKAFVIDQLEHLGGVISKSMFGAVGLYHGDVFFGIIAGDTLYLRVDADTRESYEAAGMEPFQPYPARSGAMQYYAVPLTVLEDAEELAHWSRRAVEAALKGKKKRKN